MIDGEAGSGKTTFVKSICAAWTANVIETNRNYDCDFMKQFYILIVFILRHVNPKQTIMDLIGNQFKELTVSEICSMLDMIKSHPEKVCVIFDGFDELKETKESKQGTNDLLDIITRKVHKDVVCITTTRPQGLIELQRYSSKPFQAHVKLCGFKKEQIVEYTKKYFTNDVERAKEMIENVDQLGKWQLARIPIRLQMMCFVWKNNGSFGEKIADLYNMLVMGLIDQMEKRDGRTLTREDKVQSAYQDDLLLRTGELANTWDEYGNLKILFSISDIEASIGQNYQDVLDFGCLTRYFPTSIMKNVLWNFTHLSLQEYFVAYNIAKSSSQQVFYKFLKKCCNVRAIERHSLIIEFMCSLAPDKANAVIKQVVKLVTSESDCNTMLRYLFKFLEAYNDESAANFPLPKRVNTSVGVEDNRMDPCRLIYLEQLFLKDHKTHKNMAFLTVCNLDEIPEDIHVEYLTGLNFSIKERKQIPKASKFLEKLSFRTKELNMQILNNGVTDSDIEQLCDRVKTDTIEILSLLGYGAVTIARKMIKKQQNLSSLTLQNPGKTSKKEQLSEIYNDLIERQKLRELNLNHFKIDGNISSLGRSVRITLKNKFDTAEELDVFGKTLSSCKSSIPVIDLSLSNFSHMSNHINPGTVLGRLVVTLPNLKVLKLRKCNLNTNVLSQIAATINDNSKVSVRELDLLGNKFDNCEELLVLEKCFPNLEVLLFTCFEDSQVVPNITLSKLMVTGIYTKEQTVSMCEITTDLSELYMVYCLPQFSKTRTLTKLRTLCILNLTKDGSDTCFQSLTEALDYMPNLRELILATDVDEERTINEVNKLVRSSPRSLNYLNLYGYYFKPITHILQEKQHLKRLSKLNIGSKEIDEENLQVIRQELQQLNSEIQVYSDKGESITRLLFCCVSPPSEMNVQYEAEAEELLQFLK